MIRKAISDATAKTPGADDRIPERVRNAMLRERVIEQILGPDADPRTTSSLAESFRKCLDEARGTRRAAESAQAKTTHIQTDRNAGRRGG